MKSSSVFLAVVVAGTVAVAWGADPYQQTAKKIKNLLSTFPTAAQVKKMADWVLDQAYDNKSPEYVQSKLIDQGMSVLTAAQKAQITTLYAKMSNELGGAAQTERLLQALMNSVGQFVKPFVDKTLTVMTNQKKKGAKKAAVKKKALAKGLSFLTKGNVQKAVNKLKKEFSAQQCQIAFKYLAPTYMMLGKYSFLKPPCTGKGV